MFRYLLDLKDPGTAATALGKAFHETIARNFRQKQQTTGDSGEAERSFRREAERHSGMIPNTIGA
jgi:hypothetical protein